MAVYPHFIAGETYTSSTTPTVIFSMVSVEDHISVVTSIATFKKASISKNGGAFAALTNAPVELDSATAPGVYKVVLTATETNTVGPLVLAFEESSCDPTLVTCRIYNYALVGSSMTLDNACIKAGTFDTGAITSDSIADEAITSDSIKDGAITSAKFADGAIDAGVLEDSCIQAIHLKADAVEAIADGAWIKAMPTTPTVGSMAAYLRSTENYASEKLPSALATVDGKLPAALVGGRIDASVGSMAANTISDTAIAAAAVTKLADGNWDSLTSGITQAGSIGKLVVDNIDATISSVNAGIGALNDISTTDVATTLTSQGLTTARAGYLDLLNTNLNATVSSRAAPGDAMALSATGKTDVQAALTTQGLTTTRAAYLDTVNTNLNATVSSRAAPGDNMGLSADGVTAAWGKAVSELVGVGTVGKLLADNVNATIGSRAATGDAMALSATGQTNVQSALSAQGLTAARAGYLDLVNTNLNATVSSRAAPGDAMALSTTGKSDVQSALTTQGLTSTRAGYLDLVNTNLNATVGSRAAPGDSMTLSAQGRTDVQTALTSQGLSSTRAGYLDLINTNLNATVGSRAAPGDAMTLSAQGKTDVQAALTSQGLTAARAGYLDTINTNLNDTITSRASASALSAVDGKLPSALVGGKMDSNIGSITDGSIVTASFGAGAITSTVAPNLDTTISSRASASALSTVDGKLPTALVNGRIDASMGAVATGAIVADSFGAGAISATVAPNLDASVSSRAQPGDNMGLSAGGKTSVQDALTAQGLSPARSAKLDNVDAAITTRSAPGDAMTLEAATLTDIRTALMDEAGGIDASVSVRQALRIILAVLAGKSSISGSTVVFRDTADGKDRVTATMSGSERTSVTLDKT